MKEWTREKRLRTRSVGGTLGLGEIMTELLRAPKLVVLRGELGAGKTTLVKGMAAALGAADAEEVVSPTFTLVHEYRGRKVRLFHLDLYRLETEAEVEGLGLWEMADEPDALVLVEWGDKFPSVMERADAEIVITQGEVENERLLHVRWRD
ncbi:tRNA (adenosine(37)-N6)-threonylcarbamoyltransferase complex ATPase subunit type 1 TsaE [Granulicella mallensis]|uniref:tRNA threonylcarbamoyladenosine biosynthesis protein TsaE n=1 Tax=Granulicella mallensis TaxID=940614 RepID=A0A7W7ZVB3_9BACT|nr:tRNA (adenosine(37)-N6)-threonylcarbamoyltransferase complex ATPase subunit type 1 TsaE [Granulicella mallensis]MBB5066788.1 tRNA threonylcarbamoyladenosine biosynthesis protein TsaE [Granulicella mallensis]